MESRAVEAWAREEPRAHNHRSPIGVNRRARTPKAPIRTTHPPHIVYIAGALAARSTVGNADAGAPTRALRAKAAKTDFIHIVSLIPLLPAERRAVPNSFIKIGGGSAAIETSRC